MTLFFTCIIFVGSGLTLFALLLMLYEKKRLHDYRGDLKEGKDALIKVIEDAEELISEMNRFSDYAVTQIEEKNNILLDSIAEADLKIQILDSMVMEEETSCREPLLTPVYDEASIDRILEEDKPVKDENKPDYANKGKVLTFDLKRREIIKLAKAGKDSTEIARLLNCGKGEIELIARMGR
ncbi:MAG: hypothetical protein GX236_04950 [Clostridiaceae bacterium]|jgi:hypothetical protein|nr:hypothetical protein [Clostridiaceae bacterium]